MESDGVAKRKKVDGRFRRPPGRPSGNAAWRRLGMLGMGLRRGDPADEVFTPADDEHLCRRCQTPHPRGLSTCPWTGEAVA